MGGAALVQSVRASPRRRHDRDLVLAWRFLLGSGKGNPLCQLCGRGSAIILASLREAFTLDAIGVAGAWTHDRAQRRLSLWSAAILRPCPDLLGGALSAHQPCVRLVRCPLRVLVLLDLHIFDHLLGLGPLLRRQQGGAILRGSVDAREVRPVGLEQVRSFLLVAHDAVFDVDLLWGLGLVLR